MAIDEKRATSVPASRASTSRSDRRRWRTITTSATKPPDHTAPAATWARSLSHTAHCGSVLRVCPDREKATANPATDAPAAAPLAMSTADGAAGEG